jgi:cell pole-organizing protein PopZ
MSDAKGQQHEPSMEEILASIRRIIAEDGDAAAPVAAAADSAPAPAAVAAPPPAPAPSPAPVAAPPIAAPKPPPIDDILELTEVIEPDEPAVEAAPPPPEPPPRVPEFTPAIVANERPAPAAERIVSPATAAASVAAFSQIASLSAARDRDLPLGAGHLTLEALVREELRPILKAWLDQHLPDTVERLVQEEIAQLVRDVQRR